MTENLFSSTIFFFVVVLVTETEKEALNDEFEVLYKKLRTVSRRLYVVEEEIDELYAKIEKIQKEKQSTAEGDEVLELKKLVDGIVEEIGTLRTEVGELEDKVDDLDRRLVDCEEDIKKLFDELDDLKNYTTKAFAIAKKVERHLGLEEEDEKNKRSRRRR